MDRTMFKKAARFLTRPGISVVFAAAVTLTTAACDFQIIQLPSHLPGGNYPQPQACQPGQPCPPRSAATQQRLDAVRLQQLQQSTFQEGTPYQGGAYQGGGFGTQGGQRQRHIFGDPSYQQAQPFLRPDQAAPGFPPVGSSGGGGTYLVPDPRQGQPRWQEATDLTKGDVLCLAPYEPRQDVRNPNKIVCSHLATGELREPFLKRAITILENPHSPSDHNTQFPNYGGACQRNETAVILLGDGTKLESGYEVPKCWNHSSGSFRDPQPTAPLGTGGYPGPGYR